MLALETWSNNEPVASAIISDLCCFHRGSNFQDLKDESLPLRRADVHQALQWQCSACTRLVCGRLLWKKLAITKRKSVGSAEVLCTHCPGGTQWHMAFHRSVAAKTPVKLNQYTTECCALTLEGILLARSFLETLECQKGEFHCDLHVHIDGALRFEQLAPSKAARGSWQSACTRGTRDDWTSRRKANSTKTLELRRSSPAA